jgi:crotonobetainyl-CoA:carnitine CoA-transferase CaiB-like acyl-CoA transferase
MTDEGLESMRVLELGAGVSGAFAARQFADHAADVVKLEEPDGDWSRRRGPFPSDVADPERSGLYLALNTNKRGVCLDLDQARGRDELFRLIDWADVLVHNHSRARAEALGIDRATLERRRPDLVTLSITPFGASGPHADFAAEELTVSCAGGWASLCPAATGRTDLPPLKVSGHQCAFMSGIAGATVAMAAYSAARESGVGEHIDFSEQAYTASVLENAMPLYTYRGEIATRYGARIIVPWRIFECRDGALFIGCMEADQWERLADAMGNPEWSSLEVFENPRMRSENQDILHHFIQEWLADQSVFEVFHELQRNRVCAAPVMSLAQMSESEQLQARAFFSDVEHTGAGRLKHLAPTVLTSRGRPAIRNGAPRLGEHTKEVLEDSFPRRRESATSGETRRPLEGVRVADLSWAWAGPFCAMNLAHLGADVIRFESEGRPDLYRRLPLHPQGIDRTLNTVGMFNQWNQGKRSVALNLAEARARALLLDFIETCDVVVENFATGVMDRLGLGYEVLAERNPGIILASISGYGETGPLRNYMGYGPSIPPLTGLSAATGFVGGEPSEVGVSMPDPTAGITAAFEVCTALEARKKTGRGVHLDVSLWEATAAFSVESWMAFAMNGTEPTRQGNRDEWMSPHGCFPTRGDDEWISIACTSDEAWIAICEVVAPDLTGDTRFARLADRKRNEDALEESLAGRTVERDRWELTNALQARGIAAFPAQTPKDLVEDAQLEARHFFERLPHPEVGVRTHTGIPYRLGQRENGVRSAAPLLGADTEAVLGEVLGMSPDEIRTLRADKVLF